MRRASRIVLNRDQNSTHELRTDYGFEPSNTIEMTALLQDR
jgi:hypothetical protein